MDRLLMSKCIELNEKYIECPECGNTYIGNGEGGLVIDDFTFDRWCKCGWKVHIDVREEENESGDD